jgi:hypothetical protein
MLGSRKRRLWSVAYHLSNGQLHVPEVVPQKFLKIVKAIVKPLSCGPGAAAFLQGAKRSVKLKSHWKVVSLLSKISETMNEGLFRVNQGFHHPPRSAL